MKFLETSAKEADNVDLLFTELARELTAESVRSGSAPLRGATVDFNIGGGGGSSAVSSFPSCCRLGWSTAPPTRRRVFSYLFRRKGYRWIYSTLYSLGGELCNVYFLFPMAMMFL